jgi:hypothetical protein
LVDDPRLAPAASVADVRSGIAMRIDRPDVEPESTMEFTFSFAIGSNFPQQGVRIGVLVDQNTAGDDVNQQLYWADSGGNAVAGSVVNTLSSSNGGTMGNFDGYFFDLTGNEGDTYVLRILQRTGQNNVVLSGLTFDVVPEPASLTLLGMLTGGLLLRRRRV